MIEAVKVEQTPQPQGFSIGPELSYPISPIKLASAIVAIELHNCGQLTGATWHAKTQNVV
jgi:hypothetical protein